MMNHRFHLLYSSCIPVAGAKYKIICDLERSSYVRIPDGLYEILTEHRGRTNEEIKEIYGNKYDGTIDNYFKTLVDNEFAFTTDNPEKFPELSMDWHMPFEIFNAIIDQDKNSSYNIEKIVSQLSGLNCKYLQIRFFDVMSLGNILNLLDFFEKIRSPIIGLELLLPASISLDYDAAKEVLCRYNRVNKVVLHGSITEFSVEGIDGHGYLVQTPIRITSESHCGVVDETLFTTNIKSFTEAKKFNSCLNGKVSVDRKGFIRNCPSMKNHYGHVDEVSIVEAIKDAGFKKVWGVTKDQINICKNCEYRYICTDCRAYTQNSELYAKPSKCNYDPYSGVWSD